MHQFEDTDWMLASRRTFCVRACHAASLALAGPLLQACGGNSTSPSDAAPLPTINAASAGGAITVTIDAASPLAAVGSLALVQGGSTSALVAHTGQDTFTALTAVCTHEGCTITGVSGQTYVCPCHGSEFNTGGGVVKGPAAAPLRQFTTRFASNALTITL
jgi:nitrite reductase/ring-hydroxylating ferredoxin subunit